MAVIINEFEVVVEQPSKASAEPGVEERAEGGEPPQGLTPMDFDAVLRQRLERLLRVRAD
jgi:hypothetical protein